MATSPTPDSPPPPGTLTSSRAPHVAVAARMNLQRIAEAILSTDASSTKAVCAQLRVLWELHEAEGFDNFSIEEFSEHFQRICRGAVRALS